MTSEYEQLTNPRILAAIEELQELISARFPAATFSVGLGEDPPGVYLRPVVDVDDRGEVVDVFIDRLTELQVEGDLPLYVVTRRPPERNAAILLAQSRTSLAASST